MGVIEVVAYEACCDTFNCNEFKAVFQEHTLEEEGWLITPEITLCPSCKEEREMNLKL